MRIILNKFLLIINFIFILTWQIIAANLRVAYDVITPKSHARPGVIAIPIYCKSNLEITLLAIVISLTPGTIVLDLSSDKKYIYIHAMFLTSKEKITNDIKRLFERPIMRILK